MKSNIFSRSYQSCGCVSPTEWSSRSVVLPGTNTIINAPICAFTSTCYSDAIIRLSNTTSLWNEFCSDCTEECSTADFLVTPSALAAPSSSYSIVVKGFVESVSVPLPTDWTTNWPVEVQNNYVSLEVICDSTQIQNYTQDASISIVGLISNVGGQTGLWIGMSFLSIVEVIELIYRLCRYKFHIIRTAIQNKVGNNNQI
jgi:hypothetical protein